MATQEIDIHGHKVRYDDDSETVKRGIHYLKAKIDKEEAKVFFDDARRDHANHTAHFEVHDYHGDRQHDMTLVHNSDGSYHLRKRLHR